ncbi:FACT complex subunit ssrp1-B [Toxocara canis]|uniref:FACT complex subunit SSRP1 n=1 Tax=Toxocara canis TaxID=6265 RepID=A0A0B2W3L1_TOXCA|nr:FACT complex subunit ssrp1-B [Toxocara canis]
MVDAFLEYNDIVQEDMGYLNTGRIKLADQQVQFKNTKTGKLQTISTSDIEKISWMRLANKPGLKFSLSNGMSLRFGGFSSKDYEKIKAFAERNWSKDVVEVEQSIKGWNYGKAEVKGQVLEFEVDEKPCFEIPLSNVSNCTSGKSEAVLEFHQNDDCAVSLMEMRFHIPTDPDAEEDADPVEEFRRAVMQYAGIETETDQPVATLQQILCTTPRGRYDIKVYQNHLSLHGKTYDYKIPIKTIMRLFLLPHKDGRHMYFVISLNPPIRQGQTRYHFLVLEFTKDEEVELDLGLTQEQLKEQYKGKLDKKMSGNVFEVVSKIFRVMVDMKITVPGTFVGHSGTPAIMCAHKQTSGFLYPLEKGFVYVHKPPMYIRFEEISSVNFARSDVSTRSFDFEVEMKGGSTLVFNSVEKEEYNRLFDFVNNKHLRIRNAKRLDKPNYSEDKFAGSDDEIDPYKETVKQEAKDKEAAEESDEDSDSEDEDYDVEADAKRKKEAADSSEGSGSEPEEEYDSNAGDSSEVSEDSDITGKKKEKKAKESKPKKEKKEQSEKKAGKREKKKKKDPNAPKKPQSAYFLWFGENYANFRKEGLSAPEAAQRAGKMWKEEVDAETKQESEAPSDDESE